MASRRQPRVFGKRVTTVVVCGGGNGAHVACAWLGSIGVKVHLFTRRPEQWCKTIRVTTKGSSWEHLGMVSGPIARVSARPEDVVPGADVVIVAAPAHAHRPLLCAIAPHVTRGVWVGTLYGQGGFDWAVASAFSSRARGVVAVTFGLTNIPWICQKVKYGASARIIGPKKKLYVAATPTTIAPQAALLVEALFGIPTETVANFLSLTLTPSNQIIHPARYYAIFHDYDGKKVYQRQSLPAKLYADFDEASAEHLARLDNELQQIKLGLEGRYPQLDLSAVLPIGERVVKQYGADVADSSSLKSIFATNLGYAGCFTPMVECPGGVRPATESRLFWEDIPFGLVILKDLALHLGFPTPSFDFMIRWHQQFMGKTFLRDDGTLNPSVLHETGCPSGYGLQHLDQIVAGSLPVASRL